ncbi:hypothetical protein [Pyrobaculum neutrophilum]|uniref:Uncharacterized protein n=1 Tax=Pyrobaculum neutrophilum (strain DSM 2338 / JCM 9278 / NBRC 100436 / V24Sta) TaxID=444157 RepID=B1YA90_PYRNV|nr:hypothetical protein [Pyrobaculum neutrophilum]ACB39064.1 hypothetical protein Tneu_0106 [Pyrobaculum neutrophilum V24Sta]
MSLYIVDGRVVKAEGVEERHAELIAAMLKAAERHLEAVEEFYIRIEGVEYVGRARGGAAVAVKVGGEPRGVALLRAGELLEAYLSSASNSSTIRKAT